MNISLTITADSADELLETLATLASKPDQLATLATLATLAPAAKTRVTENTTQDTATAADLDQFEDTGEQETALDLSADLLERDDTGMLWDERIFAGNKARLTSGAWKPKRGVRKDQLPLYTQVFAELEVERQAFKAAVGPGPVAPPAGAGVVLPGDPMLPGTVVPITQPVVGNIAAEVNKVITKLSQLLATKRITPEMLPAFWESHGITGPPDLPHNPNVIPGVLLALEAY